MKNKRGYQKLLAFIKNKEAIKSSCIYKNKKGFEKAFGKKPLAVRRGGSIPIISTFEQVLGIKTVLMGFGLESNAIHSPNENIPLDIFRKGIEAVVEFYLNYK